MAKRQSARKLQKSARPNLRLVKPPKPKRRTRRWKLPRNLRSIRKPKYGANPELLRYEEEIVLAVITELGGASLPTILRAHPNRFRRKYLWRTIQRLRRQDKLTGWRSYSPTGGKPRNYETYRPRQEDPS